MDIKMTQFQQLDQMAVRQFILKAWEEFGFVYVKEYDYDLDDVQSYFIKAGGMFLVLKDGEKIIGTIGMSPRDENIVEFKRFYIEKNYRGSGYGSQLFDAMLHQARKKKFKKIVFDTEKFFTKAHGLYLRRGFIIVNEDKESYFMEKEL